jgi:predicted DNA-binding protein
MVRKKSKIQRKTFTIRLDPEVWKGLRMKAIEIGKTTSDCLEEAIKVFLQKQSSE